MAFRSTMQIYETTVTYRCWGGGSATAGRVHREAWGTIEITLASLTLPENRSRRSSGPFWAFT